MIVKTTNNKKTNNQGGDKRTKTLNAQKISGTEETVMRWERTGNFKMRATLFEGKIYSL